jgi:hypothetical protein
MVPERAGVAREPHANLAEALEGASRAAERARGVIWNHSEGSLRRFQRPGRNSLRPQHGAHEAQQRGACGRCMCLQVRSSAERAAAACACECAACVLLGCVRAPVRREWLQARPYTQPPAALVVRLRLSRRALAVGLCKGPQQQATWLCCSML